MLDYHLKNAGDTAIVVEFGEGVDRDISSRVVALADALRSLEAPGIVELIPTFRSLMIRYEPVQIEASDVNALVTRALALGVGSRRARRRWTIPVCFDDPCAPDAQFVSAFAGVDRAALPRILSEPVYHVYMLGFLPGQPYLGDLPANFDMPRRPSPRPAIPAGSVGVAKRLVCIYPAQTPCGWHIIGRCAALLWEGEGPLLQAGDEVRLTPVAAGALGDPTAPFIEEIRS